MSELLVSQSFQDITLSVIPNKEHDFLLSTAEVAKGYGTTTQAIRNQKQRHHDEILEKVHYVKGDTICDTLLNGQPHQIFWTKRGVVKLGFFIKSNVAKEFRTWAENLIINELDGKNGDKPKERSLEEIISLAKDILTAMNKNPQTNRFLFYTHNGMTQILPVEQGACVVNPSNVINITTFIREFAAAETIPAIIESGVARLRRAADWAERRVKQA